MSRFAFGVKVYVGTNQTDQEIGLYAGIFKWSTVAIPQWKDGILLNRNFAKTSQSVDLRKSGNIAHTDVNDVVVDNGLNIVKKAEALAINFSGKKTERVRIDLVTNAETVIHTGICEDCEWDESTLTIPVSDIGLKTDANITRQINAEDDPNASDNDIGKALPATFGWIDKAKMIRTANKTSIFETATLRTVIQYNPPYAEQIVVIGQSDFRNINAFPVVTVMGAPPSLTYRIALYDPAHSLTWYVDGVHVVNGTYTIASWIGRYLKIIKGAGQDQYRQITDCQLIVDPATCNYLLVTVSDYFEEQPQGNLTADHETSGNPDNSWVQIVDVDHQYDTDTWPCYSYADDSGTAIAAPTDPFLYAYSENKQAEVTATDIPLALKEWTSDFIRLPNYAYEDVASTGNYNRISLDVKHCDGDPDRLAAFLILPPRYLAGETDHQLSNWGRSNWSRFGVSGEPAGVYRKYDYPFLYPTANMVITNAGDAYDRSMATFAQLGIEFTINDLLDKVKWCYVVKIKPPIIPDNFTFDNLYLVLYSEQVFTPNAEGAKTYNLRVKTRGFMGEATEVFPSVYGDDWDLETGVVSNLPRGFYISTPGLTNQAFYYASDASSAIGYNLLTGHKQIDLSHITTPDQYQAIKEIGLFFDYSHYASNISNCTGNVKIYEIALAFKKSISIKDALFTSVIGRRHTDTWGGRVVLNSPIVGPVEMMEHLDRLKNWSHETSAVVDWGHAYSSAAKINTTGNEGGYDSTRLDTVVNATGIESFGRQILNYDDAWISALQLSICEQFLLAKYRDGSGQECLSAIGAAYGSCPDTITLDDIPSDSDSIVFKEPLAEDMPCGDVYVKYNKNYGSDKYDGIINVTNTNADTYDPSYVAGYVGPYKEAIWTRLHDLWLKYGRNENQEKQTIELSWVRNSDLAGQVFVWRLQWIEKRRTTVTVYYDKAKDWLVCRHVNLNLPHQTEGVSIECLIEGITKDPDAGTCELDLILYGTIGGGGGSVSWSRSSSSASSDSTSSESVSSSSASSESGVSHSISSSSASSVSTSSVSVAVPLDDSHHHDELWESDNENRALWCYANGMIGLAYVPHAFAAPFGILTRDGIGTGPCDICYRTHAETLMDIGAVGGSGTLNYLSKWTPDGTHLGNSIAFDDGTNLSVGCAGAASAGAKLDVNGFGVFRTTTTMPSAGGASLEVGYDGTAGYGYIASRNRTAGTYLNLMTDALATGMMVSGTQKVWLNSTGFGIGATPSYLFHVTNTDTTTAAIGSLHAYVTLTIDPVANSAAQVICFGGSATHTGTKNNTLEERDFSFTHFHAGTGTLAQVRNAVFGTINHAGGTITAVDSLYLVCSQYTGVGSTIGTYNGIYLYKYKDIGTITTYRAIYNPAWLGGGTATNDWFLYSETGNSYHSGNFWIGTNAGDRLLHAEVVDATTNATVYAQRLSKVVTGAGVGAVNLGTGVEIELETATNNTMHLAGAIECYWTDAAAASSAGCLAFSTGAVNNLTRKMYIDSAGDVSIGTTPSTAAQLTVYNQTVNTTATYRGVYFAHTKTAGVSDYADDFYGLDNQSRYNQAGGEIGYLYGFRNYMTITDGTIGAVGNTRDAYGIYGIVKQDGGTVTAGGYGVYATMDLNAGTISGTAINLYSYIDHEDAHTLSGDLIGVRSYMTRGTGLVGEAIGFQTYIANVNDIHYDAVNGGINWSDNQFTAWGSLSNTPKDMSADSFWRIKLQSGSTGGAIIESFTDAAAATAAACIYRGYVEDGPTANGVHTFRAYEHDGAGALTTLAAGDRILSVQNTTTQVFAVEADGKTMVGGTVAAQSLLHVYAGASGTTPVAGTVATIEDDADTYVSLLTPNASASGILLGDVADNDVCRILRTSTDMLQLWANGKRLWDIGPFTWGGEGTWFNYPGVDLDFIVSASGSVANALYVEGGTGNVGINMVAAAGYQLGIKMDTAGEYGLYIKGVASLGGYLSVVDSADAQIAKLDATGQLMIGSATATSKLHVHTAETGDGIDILCLSDTTSPTGLIIGFDTANAFYDNLEGSGTSHIFKCDGAAALTIAKLYTNARTCYQVGGTQVVGSQGAHVANATGAGDIVAQFNTLLTRLEAHGLLAAA